MDKLYTKKQGYATTYKNEKNYNLTYGELTYNGLRTIYGELRDKFKDGIKLIDLGSGRGKIPIMGVLFFSFEYATGVELVPERHEIANSILNELGIDNQKKLNFILGDIFDISDEELSRHNLIFISNLCFASDMNDKLYDKLKNVDENTIIVLSKRFQNNEVFAETKIENVEMSWSKSNVMYTYQKRTYP